MVSEFNSAPIHRVINFLKQVKIVEPYSGLTVHAKKMTGK